MVWAICGAKKMDIKIIIVVIVIAILVCLLTIIVCLTYVIRTFDILSEILEQIISKQTNIQLSDLKDTRQSKLIHQLKKVTNMVNEDIRKSDKEKEIVKGLISDISHQLKTPLANILMYTDLLKDNSMNEEDKQEFIKHTREQTLKIQWLIKSLIKTSRLETGAINFEANSEYIKATIANSVSSIYSLADNKDIKIIVEEFEDIKLFHNPKWTEEAFTNILENALKYSPPSSEIKIKIVQMNIYTKIQISDKGIGIHKEDFNNLFKRFYRSKESVTYEGSGIGLYLSQLIVSKEGGYISVKSEIDKGSTFSVFLQNCKT